MADKTSQQKEVETTVEEVPKSKAEEVTKSKAEETTTTESENGDSKENGEAVEKENGKETEEDSTDAAADTDKVCCVKRKSTGGDVQKETPAEDATPEKKAKLSETTEVESNGEAEVAA